MGSQRLPGKVLKPVTGRALLGRMLDRLRRSKKIETLTLATSHGTGDDLLADFAQEEGLECYRGSETDVLGRFAECAAAFPNYAHVMRVTGDCPLIDPVLLDEFITEYLTKIPAVSHYHLGSPNVPRGLDAELFSVAALAQANLEARSAFQREHVTPYLYQNPDIFKSAAYFPADQGDYAAHRWCVDEMPDLLFVRKIFDALLPLLPEFGWRDVIDFLDKNPDIAQLNQNVVQKT